jgi:hypothetical protein
MSTTVLRLRRAEVLPPGSEQNEPLNSGLTVTMMLGLSTGQVFTVICKGQRIDAENKIN